MAFDFMTSVWCQTTCDSENGEDQLITFMVRLLMSHINVTCDLVLRSVDTAQYLCSFLSIGV